jgi:PhnB protein
MTTAPEPTLTPFLLFDGNCAEAMTFYHSVLGGELTITRVGDMGMPVPPEVRDKVAHAHLEGGTIAFSATDWQHPTRQPRQGNTVAMYLDGGTYEDLKVIFDRLSDGADPALRDELRQMPFGTYGHLADRFGVHWFFRGNRSDASA